MAKQTNNLQLVEDVEPYVTRNIEEADDLEIDSSVALQGGTVDITADDIRMAAASLYLGDGYETQQARTGGFVFNYLPTGTTANVGGAFTPGVAAVSNPTVITDVGNVFAVNDLVQFAGTNTIRNSGLYEVQSHVGTTLTVRGVGVSARVEDFTKDQFTADTVVVGTIRKVNVSVLRGATGGGWEIGKGAETAVLFAAVSDGRESIFGAPLQNYTIAYGAGNRIDTITYADGRVKSFAYGAGGRVDSITLQPDNIVKTFNYTGNLLTSVSYTGI